MGSSLGMTPYDFPRDVGHVRSRPPRRPRAIRRSDGARRHARRSAACSPAPAVPISQCGVGDYEHVLRPSAEDRHSEGRSARIPLACRSTAYRYKGDPKSYPPRWRARWLKDVMKIAPHAGTRPMTTKGHLAGPHADARCSPVLACDAAVTPPAWPGRSARLAGGKVPLQPGVACHRHRRRAASSA